MTVYEDMSSSPARMTEYLTQLIMCASCPAADNCNSGNECKDRLMEYLKKDTGWGHKNG